MSDSISTWTCSKCTFINEDGSHDDETNSTCMICQEPREFFSSSTRDNASDFATMADHTHALNLNDNKSVRFSELFPVTTGKESDGKEMASVGQDSISALGNMSFAAWESDRTSWTCKACTFVNEPRFLICGACEMAEGSFQVENEFVASGLQRMPLADAQCYLKKELHEHLDGHREDKIRHEHAVEVLKEQIKEQHGRDASNADNKLRAVDTAEIPDDAKQSSSMNEAKKHIETLERIQKAENEEHNDMLRTIEQWREALREEPDEEQEVEVCRQEDLLHRRIMEWRKRDEELEQLRMRLEGNPLSV